MPFPESPLGLPPEYQAALASKPGSPEEKPELNVRPTWIKCAQQAIPFEDVSAPTRGEFLLAVPGFVREAAPILCTSVLRSVISLRHYIPKFPSP